MGDGHVYESQLFKGLKKKLATSAVLFAALYFAPLYFTGHADLVLHPHMIAVILAGVGLWFTQPQAGVDDASAHGDWTMLAITLGCSAAVISSVHEWATTFGTEAQRQDGFPQRLIGWLIIAFGLWIRTWAIRTLETFSRFTVAVDVSDEQKLITNKGPYQLVRHPSYLGSFAIFVGSAISLKANGYGIIISVVAIWLSYVARIGAEETALIKVFGKQYTDWKKKSSRLFPGIW